MTVETMPKRIWSLLSTGIPLIISTASPLPVKFASTTNPFPVKLANTSNLLPVRDPGFGAYLTYRGIVHGGTLTTIYNSSVWAGFLLINDGANNVHFAANANANTASLYIANGEHIYMPVNHTKLTLACASGNTASVRIASFLNT